MVDLHFFLWYNGLILAEGGKKVKALLGTYEHQLDAKNRIRIPAKFRKEMGDELFFMLRPSGCIGVYSREGIDPLLEKLNNVTTKEELEAARIIYRSIQPVEEDTQGRIVLSASLRAAAKIERDVVTVGMGRYLEIWPADRCADEDAAARENAFALLGAF